MRISASSEESLPSEGAERSLHEDAAMRAIKDSFNIPTEVKLFGGSPVVFRNGVTTQDIHFPAPMQQELETRGELGEAYARQLYAQKLTLVHQV